ncbi:helix-turn-helix domain-containing protein [Aquirufa sp. TARAVU-A1A]
MYGFRAPTLFVPYYAHVIFRMFQSFLYLLASFRLFYNSFKANQFRIKSERGYHYGYYCLFFLTGFGFYAMTIMVGLRLNPEYLIYNKNGLEINKLVASPRYANAFFILAALFHPKLVFEKYFIEKSKSDRIVKFRNSTLQDAESTKYDLDEIERLFSAYIEDQPYLKAGFSLNMISEGTKLPVHQISYFIKTRYALTFNEWKNEQRINYAVELINAGHAELLTLESISLQCGYRSRANFLDAFKKVMGITPSEYLANYNKK